MSKNFDDSVSSLAESVEIETTSSLDAEERGSPQGPRVGLGSCAAPVLPGQQARNLPCPNPSTIPPSPNSKLIIKSLPKSEAMELIQILPQYIANRSPPLGPRGWGFKWLQGLLGSSGVRGEPGS